MQITVFVLVLVAAVSGSLLPEHVWLKNASELERQGAEFGQFPWQVLIRVTKGGSTMLCGGALICNRWVVTAAQCAHGATHFGIYLGARNMGHSHEAGRVYVESNYAIIHENYNPSNSANDIAIINLGMSVKYTETIKAIPLGITNYIGAHQWLVSTGWGKGGGIIGTNEMLEYVDVYTMDNNECRNYYPWGVLQTSTLCCRAAHNVNMCKTELGGPLIQKNAAGHYMLSAIASHINTEGCANGGTSRYMRIASYSGWLRTYTSGTCQLA